MATEVTPCEFITGRVPMKSHVEGRENMTDGGLKLRLQR